MIPYFLAFMVASTGGGPYYDAPPPTPQMQYAVDNHGKLLEFRTFSDCLIEAERQNNALIRTSGTFLLDATCTVTKPKGQA